MSTPEDESILTAEASVPETEYVMVSPSLSVAVTVPMAVWFSSAVKFGLEVYWGAD